MSEAEERSCIPQSMIPRDANCGVITKGDDLKSQKRGCEVERTTLSGRVEQAREITLNYVRTEDNRR